MACDSGLLKACLFRDLHRSQGPHHHTMFAISQMGYGVESCAFLFRVVKIQWVVN